jgi:hypothetical protein
MLLTLVAVQKRRISSRAVKGIGAGEGGGVGEIDVVETGAQGYENDA